MQLCDQYTLTFHHVLRSHILQISEFKTAFLTDKKFINFQYNTK